MIIEDEREVVLAQIGIAQVEVETEEDDPTSYELDNSTEARFEALLRWRSQVRDRETHTAAKM
jgi:hypothetical protein